MYYIISPIPIENFKKYHIPFTKSGLSRDVQKFFETEEGKQFLSINPLIIRRVSNKNTAIQSIATDIGVMGLCYSCPLYISFLNDATYCKNFDLGLWDYTNLKECVDMQKNNKKAKSEKEKQYFMGDINKILKECKNNMRFKLNSSSIIVYLLYKNQITQI